MRKREAIAHAHQAGAAPAWYGNSAASSFARRRRCAQSKHGPGSVLRPGAMSECPAIARIGYAAQIARTRAAVAAYWAGVKG